MKKNIIGTGLNAQTKSVLKKLMGSASAPISLNKVRDELKYGSNRL